VTIRKRVSFSSRRVGFDRWVGFGACDLSWIVVFGREGCDWVRGGCGAGAGEREG